jgi:ubiquinone/menaquinone biosynthesis C-methylase UbiE
VQSSPSGLDQLKERMRTTWMAGDFGKIAQFSAKDAEIFVDRLAITPETQVLDVACGTGNLAVPAARMGARVTGVDIAPNLLAQARQRAASEGLQMTFADGDAEQLPFPDAHFDVVMSMFGAMFAPRPELVASELARVCRHGGKIAMANWTPDGFTGKLFQVTNRYLPPSPGIPAPVLWGNEIVVRERLNANGVQVETSRRTIVFDFPFPPRKTVQLFREYFGPIKIAFSRLDVAGQAAYAHDLEKLWSEHNEAENGTTMIHNEYLEVIGTRR